MSGLVPTLHSHFRHRSSRAAHSVCTRVTNLLLACTRWSWTRGWLAPNALATHQMPATRNCMAERHFSSDTKASATVAPSTSHAVAAASADTVAAPSIRRVKHVVFTVHGYLGLPRPFFLFRAPLVNHGFHTVDFSYSSGGNLDTIAQQFMRTIRNTIDELNQRAAAARIQQQKGGGQQQQPHPSSSSPPEELRFHFICHSMGGLVLRAAISSGQFPVPLPDTPGEHVGDELPTTASNHSSSRGTDQSTESQPQPQSLPLSFGRIVMIAPPNRGSLYARTLARIPGVKRVVLSVARLSVPAPHDITDWLSGVKQSALQRLRSSSLSSSASSSFPSSSSSSSSSSSLSAGSTVASAASAPLPDVLACGDLMMTRSPEWFCTHLALPRVLYPRTLVIAGTFGIANLLPRPHDGTIALEETILPPPLEEGNRSWSSVHFHSHADEHAAATTAARADAAFASAAQSAHSPPSSPRRVSASTCGSSHMSFHAPHSALVAHPGVIHSSLQFLLTGDAEPKRTRAQWD